MSDEKKEAMPADAKNLTMEDILAADDLTLVPEYVPEWKGNVYLGVMSEAEARSYSDEMKDPEKRKGAMIRLLAYCLRNEKGDRLITPDKMDAFRKKSVVVYVRLQKKALRLNGFLEDEKETKELEKAIKND